MYSFPTVQAEITGGRSQISGNFTINEASDLANILKSGKLPAPARIIEEAIVGPSLGKEAIDAGFRSFHHRINDCIDLHDFLLQLCGDCIKCCIVSKPILCVWGVIINRSSSYPTGNCRYRINYWYVGGCECTDLRACT